jgi:hypothetical protein
MADNVPITPGAGTTVATDEIGGVHYQRMKLVDGTLDGTEAIGGDAAHGLDVDITRFPSSNSGSPGNVASSASSVTLLAANAARKSFFIFNDSTATLYVKFGATASAISFTVKLGPGGYYECPMPVYTGVVDGVWSSANGAARVTELT